MSAHARTRAGLGGWRAAGGAAGASAAPRAAPPWATQRLLAGLPQGLRREPAWSLHANAIGASASAVFCSAPTEAPQDRCCAGPGTGPAQATVVQASSRRLA